MRERLARFMAGRNGNDKLNLFLLVVDVILVLISSAVGGTVGSAMYIAVLGLLGLIYFRMLSRNLYRRSEENGKFLRISYRISAYLKAWRERWVQRRDYKFFRCPSCRATLRVPRGHGKIKIVCRKCGTSFMGRS